MKFRIIGHYFLMLLLININMNPINMNKYFDVVFYHAYCPDGTCAGWIVKNNNLCKDAKYIGYVHNKTETITKADIDNKKVLFVDISPDENIFNEIIERVSHMTIIDHHKTSSWLFNMYCKKVNTIIDMEYSGCQLAWKYFHDEHDYENVSHVKPYVFIDYIADRDLWKWRLENSKEFNTGLYDKYGLIKIECYDTIVKDMMEDANFMNNIIEHGRTVISKDNIEIDKESEKSIYFKCKIQNDDGCDEYDEYDVWICECDRKYRSEVGNRLLNKSLPNGKMPDFSIILYYDVANSVYWLSLRSDDDNKDVADIVKRITSMLKSKHTSGGHRNAAGLTIDVSDFDKVFTKQFTKQ